MPLMQTGLTAIVLAVVVFIYIKPDSHVTEKLLATYDYIIVGGGSAGSVLAARLSEDPNVTVLLLEAGGEETENWKYHVPFLAWDLMKTDADWSYYTEPQKHAMYLLRERRSYWPRGRVLGGSSILNAMVYIRGSRHDYDEWAASGCEGWSYDDILPYFLKSEDIHIRELKSSKYHFVGGPLAVSDPSFPPLSEKILKIGEETGLTQIDCNGEDMLGICKPQANIDNGVRASTSRAFLRPVMHRNNLHVATRSPAIKVNIKDKRAVGVNVIRKGRKQSIGSTKEVILSAGAIGSPQILMLSGIGPKEHLEEFNITVLADLPVGENLQDHLQIAIPTHINVSGAILPDKVNTFWNTMMYSIFGRGELASNVANQAAAFFRFTNSTKMYPDVQFQIASTVFESTYVMDLVNMDKKYATPLKEGPGKAGITVVVVGLHPKSRGTIRLRSVDPFEHPAIDPHYLENSEDIEILKKGIVKAYEFLSTPTALAMGIDINKSVLPTCEKDFTRGMEKYLECLVRYAAFTIYHPSSTCKMGASDDPTSVLDSKLRVNGVSSLRVVDASIMPNAISGNINAATIMIAEKAADLIRGKNTVHHLRNRL